MKEHSLRDAHTYMREYIRTVLLSTRLFPIFQRIFRRGSADRTPRVARTMAGYGTFPVHLLTNYPLSERRYSPISRIQRDYYRTLS